MHERRKFIPYAICCKRHVYKHINLPHTYTRIARMMYEQIENVVYILAKSKQQKHW